MKTSEEIIAELQKLLKENKERSWINDSSKVYGEDWYEEDVICVEVYRVLTKLLRFINENK